MTSVLVDSTPAILTCKFGEIKQIIYTQESYRCKLTFHLHLDRAQVCFGSVDLVHSLPETKNIITLIEFQFYLELTTSLARMLQTSLSPFLAASLSDFVTFNSSRLMAVICNNGVNLG